ncbi:TMV resistance protein N-like [Eucalyptus grandis]|uniref:TMV resistance protein N-like n=1 Tax=Eucalyptus grandis TaxID=71139 RepID=UPI00192F00D5|nr:TMV resistance protein N-like [Eucalyptus grandis]
MLVLVVIIIKCDALLYHCWLVIARYLLIQIAKNDPTTSFSVFVRDESELIERIVKEISTLLDRTPLHVAKHPIGINSRVVKLKSMLNVESDDGVFMMGLWGKGGIGKTSLAKAIYNDIFRQFEGSAFLANVRETSKGCRDLVALQEKLLLEILILKQRLVVSNVDAGTNLVRDRLCCKKVLLILDDVDDLRQLNALAGEGKWFGNGSRIIITTRDKHLLTCHGIDQDHVYEVKALEDNEARELLSKHVFQTHQKLKIRTDLVDSVLNYAEGLPLAIEVLGSFLCGRREHEWKSTLKKFSKIPHKTINNVLKISYDGLEDNEKEIFLHIACFFKG